MVITQSKLRVPRFYGWFKLMRHQKSALVDSEINMERSHSIFCTSSHKIDIMYTVTCPNSHPGLPMPG